MKHGNQGWGAHNFILGFPRVIAEFFVGAAIFQYGIQRKPLPAKFAYAVIMTAMLCFFIDNDKIAFINSITLLPLTVFVATTLSGIAMEKGRASSTFTTYLIPPAADAQSASRTRSTP